jgi:hypothetical protein
MPTHTVGQDRATAARAGTQITGRERAAEVGAPVTHAEKSKAEKRIKGMRRSLKGWLKARKVNDDAAMGKRKAKVPASIIAQTLPLARDWKMEQQIALQLHGLMSEFMDASRLPGADISKDPNAAIKLAQVAVSGKLPTESSKPQAQGLLPVLFIWPIVLVVGMVMFTIMSKISSDADVAKHKEEEISIRDGSRTDSGFWMKMAAVSVIGLIVWNKRKDIGLSK